MEIAIISIQALALLIYIYIGNIFYNLALAAWSKPKASYKWLKIINSPSIQLIMPVIKWGSPLMVLSIIICFAFTLLLIVTSIYSA